MSAYGKPPSDHDLSMAVIETLRLTLLRIAAGEDERAAGEAARTPYWSPCPDSVVGYRMAAQALRECADRLLATATAEPG